MHRHMFPHRLFVVRLRSSIRQDINIARICFKQHNIIADGVIFGKRLKLSILMRLGSAILNFNLGYRLQYNINRITD